METPGFTLIIGKESEELDTILKISRLLVFLLCFSNKNYDFFMKLKTTLALVSIFSPIFLKDNFCFSSHFEEAFIL